MIKAENVQEYQLYIIHANIIKEGDTAIYDEFKQRRSSAVLLIGTDG